MSNATRPTPPASTPLQRFRDWLDQPHPRGDRIAHRIALVIGIALILVCLYGLAAVLGIAPAAPWSPIGQAQQ